MGVYFVLRSKGRARISATENNNTLILQEQLSGIFKYGGYACIVCGLAMLVIIII